MAKQARLGRTGGLLGWLELGRTATSFDEIFPPLYRDICFVAILEPARRLSGNAAFSTFLMRPPLADRRAMDQNKKIQFTTTYS
jgi:hypothetical protein